MLVIFYVLRYVIPDFNQFRNVMHKTYKDIFKGYEIKSYFVEKKEWITALFTYDF